MKALDSLRSVGRDISSLEGLDGRIGIQNGMDGVPLPYEADYVSFRLPYHLHIRVDHGRSVCVGFAYCSFCLGMALLENSDCHEWG